MAFPFLRRSGTLPRLCGLLVILATGALFALVGCFALPEKERFSCHLFVRRMLCMWCAAQGNCSARG